MQGPHRLQLFVRHNLSRFRRGSVAPRKHTIQRSQTVHPPIGRAEIDETATNRRWRIHSAPHRVLPDDGARICIKGMHRMGIDGRHEQLAAGNDHTAQFTSQGCLPGRLQVGRDSILREATAQPVTPIGRPIGGSIGGRGCGAWGAAGSGPTFETVFGSRFGNFVTRLSTGRQCIKSTQLGRDVTGTGLGRHVQQSVAGENPILTCATDPMVGDDLVGVHIQEFHAGPSVKHIIRRGFVPVAASMAESNGVALLIGGALSHDFSGVEVVHAR